MTYFCFIDPAKMHDYLGAIILKDLVREENTVLRLAGIRLIDNVQEGNRDIRTRFYRTVLTVMDKWLKPIKAELILGIDASNEQLLVEAFEAKGYNVVPINFAQRVDGEPIKLLMKQNIWYMHSKGILELPAVEKKKPRDKEEQQQFTWIMELKRQMKEQDMIIKSSGYTAFGHPEGRHDDLLIALEGAAWLARDHVLQENQSGFVFVSKSSKSMVSEYAYGEDFPELEKSGATITNVSRHDPA